MKFSHSYTFLFQQLLHIIIPLMYFLIEISCNKARKKRILQLKRLQRNFYLTWKKFNFTEKDISAVEMNILSSVETLTVIIISVTWFVTMLQSVQLLGAMLMLIFVTRLSIGGNKAVVEGKSVEHMNS
ncbi:hypothetical protein AZF06_20310 [Priestia endophytica]|nr:hypothetical protein AZF06_20310 [Priestia endophytica]